MSLIDAMIELPQFGILYDGDPGTLNQLVAQSAVAGAGDLTAILFVAGRMFARDQAEKSGNLPHIGDQQWITESRHQMGRDDLADPRQALEPGHGLPQFRILLAEVTNLFLRGRRGVEVKVQRADELV